MPLRLIGFILVFVILLVFITLNLDNKCDINFAFKKIADVPVYLTVFVAFLIGFCAEPLFFGFGRAKKKSPEEIAPEPKPKKRWGKKNEPASLEQEGNFSEGGPYGID